MDALLGPNAAYSFFAAVGLIGALGYARVRLQASSLSPREQSRALLIAVAAFGLGAVCANAANWLLFPENLALPLSERIRAAGFTFYPGMICAIAFCAVIWRALRFPVGELLDRTAAAFPLFHGIARVGCVLTGCCYGIRLPGNALGLERFPSAAAEAAFLLGLFLWLSRSGVRHPFRSYLLAYPIWRFFAEFLRGDDRGLLIPGLPLSPSQQISLAILAGIGIYSLTVRLGGRTVRERKEIK